MPHELNNVVRHLMALVGTNLRKVQPITIAPEQRHHGERAKIKSKDDLSPRRLFQRGGDL